MSLSPRRRYLSSVDQKAFEGIKLGVVILVVNLLLDAVVYFLSFNGGDYFSFLSIWISYAMFLVIPWLLGRR